ncbi:MAG: leucyl/phenylalanyl-tRNA--protein transferase [Thermoguttaceae bacterium]
MTSLPPSRFFPPAENADSEGVVGFGGKLTSEWLLDAYQHGIFPWPTGDPSLPVPWCSPDPRAIFDLDHFHVPRRLGQTLRSGRFRVTFDADFLGVICGCATSGMRRGQTWLTSPMIRAYNQLFELGHGHSVEVWHDDRLAGGAYGLAIGGMFAAESMFYQVRDASKVALVRLVERLRRRGYTLMDIQQLTPHTAQFGAIEIPRTEYLRRLAEALGVAVSFGDGGEETLQSTAP